jgi:hypothetical protein
LPRAKAKAALLKSAKTRTKWQKQTVLLRISERKARQRRQIPTVEIDPARTLAGTIFGGIGF